MTTTNRVSALICRLASAGAAVGTATALASSVALWPPVLQGWILAEGKLNAGGEAPFYGLSILCLAFALAAVWAARWLWTHAPRIRPRSVQFSIITAAWTSVLVVAAVEMIARTAFSPQQILSGDEWWIYQWVAGQAARVSSSQFNPEYSMDRFDPELGWVPMGNYHSDAVNTTSDGLRGKREHPSAKVDGEKRIVVIGDSLTFGEGARDEDVYTEILGALLGGVRVINLGVHGYGTDQQYLRLRRLGFRYNPDLVIVGVYGPDIDRNVLAFRDYAKPVFRVVSGALQLHNVPVPDPTDPRTTWASPVPRLYAWGVVKTSLQKGLDRTRFAPKWRVTRRILDAIEDSTRAHGAPVLLVHFPAKFTSFSPDPDGYEVFLKAWAVERNVAFLSVRETFVELPGEQRRQVWHDHWTPFGNRVVAKAILEAIASERLLENRADARAVR